MPNGFGFSVIIVAIATALFMLAMKHAARAEWQPEYFFHGGEINQ